MPTLRILNSKPLEVSSKSDKSYGTDNLPIKDSTVDIDTKKKDKRKHPKQQPEVKTTSPGAPGKSELLDGKERKKDKKEAKRKKSEVEEHSSDSKSKSKEAKRKKFIDEEDMDAEGIDNTEISFSDLVFSKQESAKPKLKDSSTQEVPPAGKLGDLVIDHTKKRKKSKDMVTITDSSALKIISSVPEVGAGLGLSGWDD